MNKNKTMLITGGSGFLGTWLANIAASDGYTLFGIDLQVPQNPQIWANYATASCETVDYDQLLQGEKIQIVCHLAGGASVISSVSDPYSDFNSLLPSTAKLSLYLAKNQSQARLFFFSSAAVYGNPSNLPITESTPILPISPYGIHKAIAESLLINYSRVYGLNLTILRIFSVYGPGLRKQLIWDVCQKALKAKDTGINSITLFGTGLESRDFIYVKDLCKAILTLANKSSKDDIEIYNLASGEESLIIEVAKSIIKKLNININVNFDGKSSKGDPINWRVDTNLIKAQGFRSEYSLNKGLEEVVKWIK